MAKILFSVILILLLSGCATRQGKFSDGREYMEYDVNFDEDEGKFYIPLDWVGEQETKQPEQR